MYLLWAHMWQIPPINDKLHWVISCNGNPLRFFKSRNQALWLVKKGSHDQNQGLSLVEKTPCSFLLTLVTPYVTNPKLIFNGTVMNIYIFNTVPSKMSLGFVTYGELPHKWQNPTHIWQIPSPYLTKPNCVIADPICDKSCCPYLTNPTQPIFDKPNPYLTNPKKEGTGHRRVQLQLRVVLQRSILHHHLS